MQNTKKIDIQGHRGARGLFPENTLNGFLEAVKLGVSTLEMDVVVSKDLKVVVSHEPWMNSVFCTQPNGKKIDEASMLDFNLYQMSYEEIKEFDCGKQTNPEFPFQKSIPGHKPLLSEVLLTIEAFLKDNHLPPINYNIEIKSEPKEIGSFYPDSSLYVELVIKEIQKYNLSSRVILQSFNILILQELAKLNTKFKIGLLVDNELTMKKNLNNLGFLPTYYNPYFLLVDAQLIHELHLVNIKIVPWTVNEISDMKKLIEMGVDGIITDYPDKALELLKSQ